MNFAAWSSWICPNVFLIEIRYLPEVFTFNVIRRTMKPETGEKTFHLCLMVSI